MRHAEAREPAAPVVAPATAPGPGSGSVRASRYRHPEALATPAASPAVRPADPWRHRATERTRTSGSRFGRPCRHAAASAIAAGGPTPAAFQPRAAGRPVLARRCRRTRRTRRGSDEDSTTRRDAANAARKKEESVHRAGTLSGPRAPLIRGTRLSPISARLAGRLLNLVEQHFRALVARLRCVAGAGNAAGEARAQRLRGISLAAGDVHQRRQVLALPLGEVPLDLRVLLEDERSGLRLAALAAVGRGRVRRDRGRAE